MPKNQQTVCFVQTPVDANGLVLLTETLLKQASAESTQVYNQLPGLLNGQEVKKAMGANALRVFLQTLPSM
jgi:hypothetical protein